MFTIQDYIDSLNRDKESLVANLTAKGISASDSETFSTLVPKVLDIISVNNQSKSATITTNGTTTITPDTGYTGLSSVEVTTNVALDLSEYFTSSINSYGSNYSPAWIHLIKKLPVFTITNTRCDYLFANYQGTELPLIDTSNAVNFTNFCYNCVNLTTVPLLNTSSITEFYNAFTNCNQLTDTSLDNILQMCINATSYAGTKTLYYLGFRSNKYAVSRIEALPHYQDFIAAGWTLGY